MCMLYLQHALNSTLNVRKKTFTVSFWSSSIRQHTLGVTNKQTHTQHAHYSHRTHSHTRFWQLVKHATFRPQKSFAPEIRFEHSHTLWVEHFLTGFICIYSNIFSYVRVYAELQWVGYRIKLENVYEFRLGRGRKSERNIIALIKHCVGDGQQQRPRDATTALTTWFRRVKSSVQSICDRFCDEYAPPRMSLRESKRR